MTTREVSDGSNSVTRREFIATTALGIVAAFACTSAHSNQALERARGRRVDHHDAVTAVESRGYYDHARLNAANIRLSKSDLDHRVFDSQCYAPSGPTLSASPASGAARTDPHPIGGASYPELILAAPLALAGAFVIGGFAAGTRVSAAVAGFLVDVVKEIVKEIIGEAVEEQVNKLVDQVAAPKSAMQSNEQDSVEAKLRELRDGADRDKAFRDRSDFDHFGPGDRGHPVGADQMYA